MQDKRFILVCLALLMSIGVVVGLAQTPVAWAKGGKGNVISWSENPLRENVTAGSAFSTTVAFSSTIDLQNVVLDLTPSLHNTTTISPTGFPSVMAGVPYSVEISFQAPAEGDDAAKKKGGFLASLFRR